LFPKAFDVVKTDLIEQREGVLEVVLNVLFALELLQEFMMTEFLF
jgi:hypothetical protein